MACVAVLIATAATQADDPPQPAEPLLSASRTVIVVSSKAEAFAGNESVGKIPSGSVLRYSEENGPWLLIPRYGGWLNREEVVALERAVEYFSGIIAREPAPQAFHHRGIAQMSVGAYDAAIDDFTRAITQGLKDPGVYINRGVARQRLGNLQAAVEDFTGAIQLDPNSARAYDNRAGALAELGQFDASLADSDEALRISPSFAEAFNNRGVTWRMKGDDQQALVDYTQAIELYEGYAAAYANRGYIHKRLGDLPLAISDYEKAIELDAAAHGACNDLAWLLATSADDSVRNGTRAVELATRACELTRDRNADYLDTLAAALAETGDFASAAAKAEAALALAPEAARGPIQQRLALYQAQQPFRE
ncbi:MAG: tetratricopeptide repeat protein [Planctomycetaceae bacterium]|nr:tetratricopeptide repeat protein [Planctomycetaceae bacterium]